MIDYRYIVKQDRKTIARADSSREGWLLKAAGRVAAWCFRSFECQQIPAGKVGCSGLMPLKMDLILAGKVSRTGFHIAHFSRWPRGWARGVLTYEY